MKYILLLSALALISFRQDGWVVPKEAAEKQNPIKYSVESVEAGKATYLKHCKMCHGLTGEGTKMSGTSNFKSESFQSQSDGTIYYKNDVGYGKMPSYKSKIVDETEKWNLVNYLRSLK